MLAKRGSQYYIFKPCNSSQGKGIFVTNSLDQVPAKQNFVCSEYISNPLLINGLKFDLRIYVSVTSVNPLRIYIYEEGLARFATEKYEENLDHKNVYAHLTNYSINKFNTDKFI
jgi:tubulin polyglutamylase TTLL5